MCTYLLCQVFVSAFWFRFPKCLFLYHCARGKWYFIFACVCDSKVFILFVTLCILCVRFDIALARRRLLTGAARIKDMALRIHKVDVDIDFYCVTVCVWSELDSIAIWYKYLYVIGRGIDGRQKLNWAEGKFHIVQFSGNWSWII